MSPVGVLYSLELIGTASETVAVPHHLLPHLPELDYKLSLRRRHRDARFYQFKWELEALPYSLRATYAALADFMEEQRHIVNNYRPLKPKRTIGLSLSATYPLRFTVDSFLYSARRTQDALGRYIAKAFDMQLSTSFRGLIKSLDKYNLPKSLTDVLTNYWQSHGEQLRQYRDIADKHTIVSDHVFLFGGDDGSPRIRMLLLSNPEAKETRGPYTFGRPEVHAQRFLCDQFQHLLATCYRVTKALLQALPGEREARFGFYPRGAGPGSDAEGCQPLSAQELESTVEEMVTEIRRLPVPQFEIDSSA